MTTQLSPTALRDPADAPVRIRAHRHVVRKLGHWTTAGREWTATEAPGGCRILLLGEMRSAEVRVRRGGVAIVSAMLTREYLADAWQARREGRLPVLDDPAR